MRKAMIVWGGWPGHDPDLCASIIRGWLKAEDFDRAKGSFVELDGLSAAGHIQPGHD